MPCSKPHVVSISLNETQRMLKHPKKKRIVNRALLDLFKSFPCVVCGEFPCDPCHIKTNGSGGDDVITNLIAFCRKHHTEQHATGWRKMCNKYPMVRFLLQAKGWIVTEIGKLERVDGTEDLSVEP